LISSAEALPIPAGDHVVLIDLLGKIGLRRPLRTIAGALAAQLMDRVHDLADRRQKLAALIQQRIAEVEVVEQHVRGRAKAAVLDPVLDRDRAAAELRLEPAGQHQVLAEHRHLGDLRLGEKHAALALPALAIAQQARRNLRDAAVQRIVVPIEAPVDIALGAGGGGRQRLVQAAGREQAGERAQEAPAGVLLGRGEAWMARSGRRAPADRHAAPPRAQKIEAAVDRDLKSKAAAGANVQDPHTALRAISKLDQLDPRDLLQGAGARGELGPGQGPSVEIDHRGFPAHLLRFGCARIITVARLLSRP
jgi:hypothetical protein